jgi:BirA family biotin operon repressor/biotin-[acetyl-CoA-carboxylase] ligase
LAVSDMLARFAPQAGLALKWPNDVLAEGRKIAGILLESESGADGTAAWLAVGIGVNLTAFPEDTEFPAISLAAVGSAPPAPKDALLHLAATFAKWYEVWRTEGFAPVREAWLARASGVGSRIHVRLASEEMTGLFQGIDDNGALLLGLPGGGTRAIAAGEVFFG